MDFQLSQEMYLIIFKKRFSIKRMSYHLEFPLADKVMFVDLIACPLLYPIAMTTFSSFLL